MTTGSVPMLITGHEAGATMSARAASLLDAPVAADGPTLLLWDRFAVTWRWRHGANALAPAHRPVRRQLDRLGLHGLARRSSTAELRAYLRRHRYTDIAMVGREALGATPWLTGHRGRRMWIPTHDDVAALADGLEVPAASAGGPHRVVSLDLEIARSPDLCADGRHRLCPGFSTAAPAPVPRSEILAHGPPTRSHGIDLVGRSLVRHRHDLRSRGVVVRWVAPHGSTIPADELADLERSSVRDLISLVHVDEVGPEVERRLPTAAAVVASTRPGSGLSDDALVDAYRLGVRVVGVGTGPAPALGIGTGSRFVSLDDVAGFGDALAEAVALTWAERIPGPVGLRDLIDWAFTDV